MDGLASSIAEQSNPPSAEELWVGGTTDHLHALCRNKKKKKPSNYRSRVVIIRIYPHGSCGLAARFSACDGQRQRDGYKDPISPCGRPGR
ncbi:hypothetical protein RRG08_001643 [Elysia crispata]|uniref:Uncharacterized protein n=1 Tax=Elysia crispata TaxID=231223 RepID=A0AAE1E1B8_9GAST|nr:hypothetical protein RRG08_001643 [Elysia crispata]